MGIASGRNEVDNLRTTAFRRNIEGTNGLNFGSKIKNITEFRVWFVGWLIKNQLKDDVAAHETFLVPKSEGRSNIGRQCRHRTGT